MQALPQPSNNTYSDMHAWIFMMHNYIFIFLNSKSTNILFLCYAHDRPNTVILKRITEQMKMKNLTLQKKLTFTMNKNDTKIQGHRLSLPSFPSFLMACMS